MKTNEATFAANDGLTLFERSWLPDGPERAVVVIIHGYAEHSGRYDHVGAALAEAGLGAWALDHAGHGLSKGDERGNAGAAVRCRERLLPV